MVLLGSKMCCTESSEAAVQINILAPCYSACGVPGTSDVQQLSLCGFLKYRFLSSECNKIESIVCSLNGEHRVH